MKLPETIRILGFTINVRRKCEPWFEDGDSLGLCHLSKQNIFIKEDAGEDVQAHSVLHECVHVIEGVLMIPDLTEEDIDRIALGMLSLIRNNPTLMATLGQLERQ